MPTDTVCAAPTSPCGGNVMQNTPCDTAYICNDTRDNTCRREDTCRNTYRDTCSCESARRDTCDCESSRRDTVGCGAVCQAPVIASACPGQVVAMAYVPYQTFAEVYDVAYAFTAGTLFPELDKPFKGGRCVR